MISIPLLWGLVLRVFADLDEEEFLDVAERWIIDCWGVRGEAWRWDEEPRKGRFSERSFSSMDHSHGSRPTLERFHTYLEWHAMWCATGELMRTRALVKAGEDDYDTFEHWLGREGLTSPPLWLADLHGPKPLEDRLWFSPHGDVDRWIEDVGDDDFLTEIGLAARDGSIIVGGSYDTRSSNFMESARIETALVSPDTASALVRALQTIDNPWRYRIPPAGDDLEIDAPPYKLVGWLVDVRHESEIDERDPLRYDVHAVECRPARDAETSLNLTFVYHEQAKWIEVSRWQTVFVYGTWGDTRGNEHDDRLRYDNSVRSHGWRLQADKEALQTFLNKMGLDLIVEIQISRRNKGYDYARYGKERQRRPDSTESSSSGEMGPSKPPKDVLGLGRHLVHELGFEEGNDTLGRWMAHHLAELIDGAENGVTAAERVRAGKSATETILNIWEHRASLPGKAYPLAPYKDVLKVLDRLRPDNNPFRYFSRYAKTTMGRALRVDIQEFWTNAKEQERRWCQSES